MNEQVKEYIDKYPIEIIEMFNKLRKLVYDNVQSELKEILWARLPSYYVGDSFVRFIAFKDHINIEAKTIIEHKEELVVYKITPKGMLQIFVNQEIPFDILRQIFTETLG